MNQAQYTDKIKSLDKGCTYGQFRSRRDELAWITHTSTEVAAESAILAQVTAESFYPVHITQLNKAIKRVKEEPYLGLICHKLYLESLHTVVNADASFANLPDLKSQLGFAVLLTDKTNQVNWLHFRSYKWKRAVLSVLGGETHAFADAFDAAYALRHDIEKILNNKIPLCVVN